ncbi:hypothetical protein MIC448_2320025 [Microbacterium sp. C448]|nr:hypothetical protein MIC448_2320025 [Microbacterium sp. C448]
MPNHGSRRPETRRAKQMRSRRYRSLRHLPALPYSRAQAFSWRRTTRARRMPRVKNVSGESREPCSGGPKTRRADPRALLTSERCQQRRAGLFAPTAYLGAHTAVLVHFCVLLALLRTGSARDPARFDDRPHRRRVAPGRDARHHSRGRCAHVGAV